MDNLEDHIVLFPKSIHQAGLKEKLLEKVKSVRDIPKKKAFALVQTVQKTWKASPSMISRMPT